MASNRIVDVLTYYYMGTYECLKLSKGLHVPLKQVAENKAYSMATLDEGKKLYDEIIKCFKKILQQ